MSFFRNQLANMFTLGNLFSGTIGVIHLIQNDLHTAFFCMVISLVLDFFDGFVARALKSNSSLGAQLDSLADMVSFGVLPGIAMLKMLEPFGSEIFGVSLPFEIQYLGLFITLFSCLRLAIFNIDDEQKYFFKGLNTPTNTVLILGLLYASHESAIVTSLVENPLFLLALTALSSWLLISPIRMIAMKFKSKRIQDNLPKIILAAGSVLLLLFFRTLALPMVVLYYILVSVIFQKHLR
ncbi:CDP-alcohol phosphatidyltransferase family protein [Chryseobacterium lacus]|uniref:CDP-alcohol phosphatidyltransferase family protein n=1 Tax=Chryseobacterium lacus TaxID=2058346 RepID=UPI000F88B03C|nr:CDP-alcohol phosphatidyltransferase family protein [Chryseobacterium lacus]RST26019.1 CDP-alcohol phosphatidyltransferase [Chryseobacterium lacus]